MFYSQMDRKAILRMDRGRYKGISLCSSRKSTYVDVDDDDCGDGGDDDDDDDDDSFYCVHSDHYCYCFDLFLFHNLVRVCAILTVTVSIIVVNIISKLL